MKYKTLTILDKDYKKVKKISEERHLTLTKLFSLLIAYLDQNQEEFFLEPFAKKEEKNSLKTEVVLTEKVLKKVLTERVNTLIGFIKKQDELILDIQQDVRKGTKQVLHKIIPLDEQELAEYNPLFDDYDRVIFTLKKVLEKQGFNEAQIEKEIEKEFGENHLKNYQESKENIRIKNFLM